jgi:hypothetical protein
LARQPALPAAGLADPLDFVVFMRIFSRSGRQAERDPL